MSMVVQHNLTAMNSNRTLGITSGAQAKSTEKLSSGYKINRAADDASGLAISEKMRKQIRGLTQASTNAQDGISAVQTAEGALAEVHDMLQRMNELAVKAANGTNSETDRGAIQSEVDQLVTEIDRVAETTKFNETYLLKGDTSGTAVKGHSFSYGTYSSDLVGAAQVSMINSAATGITATITFDDDSRSDDQNAIAKSLRDSGLSVTAKKEINADGSTQYSYEISLSGAVKDQYKIVTTTTTMSDDGANATAAFSIQDAAGNTIATVTISGYKGQATNKGDSVTDTVSLTSRAEGTTAAHKTTDRVQYYDKDGNAISENALSNYVGVTQASATNTNQLSGTKLYDVLGNMKNASFTGTDIIATQDQTAALQVKLHVGADATRNNQIAMNLDAMSAKGLGLTGIRVDGANDDNALKAIETIKAAIQHVSSQRSDLGAIQNRLEHTIKNLDNVVENTTAAESQIRDTDMATEMVNYSKNNILAQAGQSMLAQANQSNQGVLSLLG